MAKSPRASRRLSIDCEACRASVEGLCKTCEPEVRRVIAGYKSSDRLVKAGNDLFRPGEECSALYLLVDGWMFLYDLIDAGRRQILHFALPGALLGLFPGRVAIYGGETLTDATVWQVPHDRLAPLIEEHPAIGLRLMWIVWRERNLAYDHLSNSRRSARERVARSLIELFVRSRMRWPAHSPVEMHLPLTQEHIGDATGLSTVHVNRILHGFRKDEILEFHHWGLRILDPDKLVDAARVDPQTILSWTGRFPSA